METDSETGKVKAMAKEKDSGTGLGSEKGLGSAMERG
jgi:hypothetical protein